jgi:tetratricopeptide (TPR) repeat protein
LALALPFVVGPVITVPLAPLKFLSGLLVAAIVVAVWWRWILQGELRPEIPVLGACVLLVNFLAAGGIGSPATAGSLWLLLALPLGLTDLDRPPLVLGLRPLMAASLFACAVALLCYATAYRPVVNVGQAMAMAASLPEDSDAWLLKAAKADPLDFQPWTQITARRFAHWQQAPNEPNWQAFDQAQARLLELRPQHSTAWMYVGDCYRAAAQQSGNRERWTAALRAYRRAVELYPNQALRRAKLAQALAESGDPAAAQREARQALRLDEITLHTDQKLSSEMRQVAARLAATP